MQIFEEDLHLWFYSSTNIFKDYRNQHSREFIEDVGDREKIRECLGLTVVPHFIPLQKFLRWIKFQYLRITFRKTVNLLFSTSEEDISITVIDSSRFTSGYCSHYFSERSGKLRRSILKTSISVDTNLQVIAVFVVSNSWVHDTRYAVKLIGQCHNLRPFECYVMDRGYDSDNIHQFIREDLNVDSIISPWFWNNEIVSGIYRKEMVIRSHDPKYHKHQLIETKFSIMKRKFGSDLKARMFLIQRKKLLTK